MTPNPKTYAADPMAFFADAPMRTEAGVVPFASVWTPFQQGFLGAVSPALLAASAGKVPAIRKHWGEATKGNGKTFMLALLVLWSLAFSRRALRILIGAFDAAQAGEVRHSAQLILWELSWLAKLIQIDKWQLSCPTTGSTCEILTSDPHGTSGGNPDIVVLDECVQITREEYAAHMLNNATKRVDAITIVTTNAGFKNTWQFGLRELARTSPLWTFHQGREKAPQIPDAEFEQARQFNTASCFARNFLGQWSSGSGDALAAELIEAAITLQSGQRQRLDKWRYTCGVDLGISNDHCAAVTLGTQAGTGRIALVDCMSWKPPRGGQVDLAAVEQYCAKLHFRFNLQSLWIDPYQAILLGQNLTRKGLRVEQMTFTGANLNRMASALLEVFASHSIDLFPDDQLIRDLGRLSIVERPFGYKIEATRDADGHADRATALAIALPGAMVLAHQAAFRNEAPRRESRVRCNPLAFGIPFDRDRYGSRPPFVRR